MRAREKRNGGVREWEGGQEKERRGGREKVEEMRKRGNRRGEREDE